MRRSLGGVAVAVLASLSCATDPKKEPAPERFACPAALRETKLDGGSLAYDTDGDEVADLTIRLAKGVRQDARVETSIGTFLVQYRAGGAISWETLPRAPSVAAKPEEPAPAPLELAPPELSRLIPDLQPPVDSACLAEPDVSLYMGELRDRMRSRWFPPTLPEDADRNVTVLFSLTASGEVTGACFKATDLQAGATAVRALEKA